MKLFEHGKRGLRHWHIGIHHVEKLTKLLFCLAANY